MAKPFILIDINDRNAKIPENTLAQFKEKMASAIDFMIRTFKEKTGHELSMEEAYAYLAWASGETMNRIMFIADPETQGVFLQLAAHSAMEHMQRFRASVTGAYEPPDPEGRFESIEAFEQYVQGMAAAQGHTPSSPENAKPYTPGGYL